MSKRWLAALLWFSVTWFGYEIAWSVAELPRIAGPILAFVVAALVTIDPVGLFWPRRPDAVPPLSRAGDGLEMPLSSSR